MKAIISISGQTSGNIRLLNALQTTSCTVGTGMYHGYKITYPTLKAARKALWDGYRHLIKQEPEFKHGIKYSKRSAISYDASTATLYTPC